MAEYLIQDTTLDAIADAINAKTGDSSAMTPAEMVTAIESIGGGGGGEAYGVTSVTYGIDYNGESGEGNFPDLEALNIQRQTKLKTIDVVTGANEITLSIGLQNSASFSDVLEVVNLHGAVCTVSNASIRYRRKLKELNAKLKIVNASYFLTACDSLESVSFLENATGISFPIDGAPNLSNDSLISCANGLDESTPNTLTMSTAQKTAANSIVGTVTNNGNYSIFTADGSGATTLLDFITNTKGWTVA